MILSEQAHQGGETPPWVVAEIRKLEAQLATAQEPLSPAEHRRALLDQFAGLAVQALASGMNATLHDLKQGRLNDDLAQCAYALAYAMLDARERSLKEKTL